VELLVMLVEIQRPGVLELFAQQDVDAPEARIRRWVEEKIAPTLSFDEFAFLVTRACPPSNGVLARSVAFPTKL
jgi:hypothetical protein